MQWIRAHVTVTGESARLMTDLVADIFFDLKVTGVEMDDPELDPPEGWGNDAVPLPSEFGVAGYFADSAKTAELCRQLERRISQLKDRQAGDYIISYQRVDEADWAQAWKEFFWPERITSRLVVKPTWRDFKAEDNDIVLEIDPGMAFGTGTHPTTSLCLAMIEKYLKPGDTMLDIGTGSGILMIAAALLGAKTVHGVDNDEVAVQVARKNLLLNGIDQTIFSIACGDLAVAVDGTYQLVVANILSEVVLRLLDDILRVMAPKSLFISSGIIVKNKDKVLSKLNTLKFETIEVAEKDEWVAIVARSS